MRGRAFAWLNLGYRFALHLLRLPVRALRRDRDLQRHLGAVLPEGYVPLAADEREAFPAFMNCIHCGLCSLACPALAAAPAPAWEEAWTFVAGPSRAIDRARLVAEGPAACAECHECAAVCPTGIPIPRLAAMVRRLANAGAPAANERPPLHVAAPVGGEPS